MKKFCPGASFDNVDAMKTSFRACPEPKDDSDIVNSEECRKMLADLMGGEDESKYGRIFASIAQADASNVPIFPYYRALSRQVHWFMVCRKANQHAKTIKAVKDDIAEKDRQLWKAELKQQAYSVYDDMLYSAEEIKNNEVAQL